MSEGREIRGDLPIWVEVDLGCIRRNAARLKGLVRPGTLLLAVVKANGYGHGDAQVARAAVEGGADWLGVARVEEGASLRAAGIFKPILLMAEPPVAQAAWAVDLDLVPTLYTARGADAFSEAARAAGRTVPVHVKIDTGMHRYGVAPEDAIWLLDALEAAPELRVEGIWSHFAVAEDVLNPFTRKQLGCFLELLELLGPRAEGKIRHLSNSAGTITLPEAHLDMVRTGIAIYGIHPSPALADRVSLEPALSLKARVGLVKRLRAGEAISYGQRYVLEHDATVATIPCGYADGLRRALTNVGEVLIGGSRYPICGTITMDHFLVDAGQDRLEAGDEVVILGRQGADAISAQQIADRMGTIPYEVVCGFNTLIPRFYLDSK